MEVYYFDLATGVELQTPTAPLTKPINNSYLEYWLQHHGLESKFYIGKFNNECGDAERQRLEKFGKFLVCTNGRDGYFTDQETARLIVEGDPNRGISPIFAAGQYSPHNLVAYGGLIPSDGMATVQIGGRQPVIILVIDDVARSAGAQPILDAQGNPLPDAALSLLYDKMGDGTLLLASQHFEKLLSPEEREYIVSNIFGENDQIGDDLSTIANELDAIDTAAAAIERKIANFTSTTVSQFRAATPDMPGMIKGTLTASDWCRRLGVDAIIASNCIKGDDGRLSNPGINTLGQLWVNRKSDGKYGKQVVGPQVKGTIPEATQNELNPQLLRQSQELAALASDPLRLARYFVEREEEKTAKHEEAITRTRNDYLLEILKADQYGLLSRFSKVNYELQKKVRGQWLNNAVSGIDLPSAMAQNHAALKPWEVCNKNLPDGAIIAYYRSPLPNVGAVAIAINNLQAIQQADPEAFAKTGISYLNPWTSKSISITDFDGDANGYFVGFLPTISDLPTQIRAKLRGQGTDPAAQYEAGRSLFERMIRDLDPRIAPADYPLAVREFIERNAPDKRPPEVVKAPKQKHPWHGGESHGQALWRAWAITADNPTGKVANTGIILQSFAWECLYCPPVQQEELLQTIGSQFSQLLRQAQSGRLKIPTNAELMNQGFPSYDFLPRISEIVTGINALPTLAGQERQTAIAQQLNQVSRLLTDMVNGPIATNLQTAVDTAKSCRGIDEDIQAFAKALAYKDHALRQSQKDPNIFIGGQTMPTNTSEPIGWGVEQTNQLFQDIRLPEVKNEVFRDLFPKEFSPAQEAKALAIAQPYNATIQRAADASDRLKEQREEDLKPTILLTSNRTGQSLTLIQPKPAALDLHGQEGVAVSILHESQGKLLAILEDSNQVLGQVALNDIQALNLKTLIPPGHSIQFNANLTSQPAYALQNEPDLLFKAASHQFKQEIGQIPTEERQAYANALWRHSEGMGVVLRAFTPEICQQLQTIPTITLTGLHRETNQAGALPPGEYEICFREYGYLDKLQQPRYSPCIAVVTDAGELDYGAIDSRSLRLPYGSQAHALITPDLNGKVAHLEVLEVLSIGQGRYPSETLTSRAGLQVPEAQPIQLLSDTSQRLAQVLPFPSATPVATLRVAEPQPTYSVSSPTLKIVTDGACSGNPGPGGWAAILKRGDTYLEFGGAVAETTNNRMELSAIIEGLKAGKAEGILQIGVDIHIITDSQYVINCAEGEWQRKSNRDLWGKYDLTSAGLNLTFEWVRGHKGHELNERADKIAQGFAKGKPPTLRREPEQKPEPELIIRGKPIKMVFPLKLHGEVNPLPVQTCFEAMRGYGRCHTTRRYEPYAAYGFQAGDMALATDGQREIVVRVGEQYKITSEMLADSAYQIQWAAREKHSAQELQSFQGKTTWGLHFEPLGDFVDGQIIPFPPRDMDIISLTRKELLDYYSTLKADAPLKGQILNLGNQLKIIYQHENNSSNLPPLEYRHPLVVVSLLDYQRLRNSQILIQSLTQIRKEATLEL
jgi:ribonuclease HI